MCQLSNCLEIDLLHAMTSILYKINTYTKCTCVYGHAILEIVDFTVDHFKNENFIPNRYKYKSTNKLYVFESKGKTETNQGH